MPLINDTMEEQARNSDSEIMCGCVLSIMCNKVSEDFLYPSVAFP